MTGPITQPGNSFASGSAGGGAARRLGALLLAVTMVGGAWLVRDRYLGGDDESAAPDDRSATEVEVACDPATGLCDRLDTALADSDLTVSEESPGATLERFLDGSDAPELWVTADLWVLIAQAAETPATSIDVVTGPLATVSLGALVSDEKSDALAQACPQLFTGCLGSLAGAPWGEPKVATVADRFDLGLDPPDSTGNLLAIANAVAEWSGTERPDIDDFDAVRAKVERMLRNAVPIGRSTTASSEFASTLAAFDVATTVDLSTPIGRGRVRPQPLGGFATNIVVARERNAGGTAEDATANLVQSLEQLDMSVVDADDTALAAGSRPNGATLEAMWTESRKVAQ